MKFPEYMIKLADPPEHKATKLAAEQSHIIAIAALLNSGWTLPGVRLVEDPRTAGPAKVLTLFEEEQVLIVKTLKDICARRRKLLDG